MESLVHRLIDYHKSDCGPIAKIDKLKVDQYALICIPGYIFLFINCHTSYEQTHPNIILKTT